MKYQDVHKELLEIFERKNAAYNGDSEDQFGNFKNVGNWFGIDPIQGIFVRISDKISRMQNIVKNPTLSGDESLQDTMMDLANYLIIAIAMMRKIKENSGR